MSNNIVPDPVMNKHTLDTNVVKDNHDGTITVNNLTYALSKLKYYGFILGILKVSK